MPARPHALDHDEKRHARLRLIRYLHEERGEEEWGELAIMLLLDTIEEHIAPLYYNKGITAAQKATRELADVFEVNLESLKRPPPPPESAR